MDEFRLWPMQRMAVKIIMNNWKQGFNTSIIAGQRAGKTIMVGELIDEIRGSLADEEDVLLVGLTARQIEMETTGTIYSATVTTIRRLSEDLRRVTQVKHLDEQLIEEYSRKYVIINDAQWMPPSDIKDVVEKLYNLGAKVLLISSRGNTEVLLPPKFIQYTYATWDWNPIYTPMELIAEWHVDKIRAERDFGFRDSKLIPYDDIIRAYKCAGEKQKETQHV